MIDKPSTTQQWSLSTLNFLPRFYDAAFKKGQCTFINIYLNAQKHKNFEKWAEAQYVYPYTVKIDNVFKWAPAFQSILVEMRERI